MATTQKFPWTDDCINFVGCNFAFSDLAIHLPKVLEVNGRLHAETYIAACGAIAGFAAQQSLLAETPSFRMDDLREDSMINGLFLVRGPGGERFIFGQKLKEMIFMNGPGIFASPMLWEWASGGAIAAGLDPAQRPDTLVMWERVTRAIKEGSDGMPSVPAEHYPHLAPIPLLKRLWPFAKKCLSGRAGTGAKAPPGIVVVEPRWWMAITGTVTTQAIQQVKGVLDPLTALILVMETAILTLKVDPTRIEKD